MIRYGTSWPGRQGRRHWVSMPLWLVPAGWFLAGLYWLFIGWWLLALCLGFYLLLEGALLLTSGVASLVALYHIKHGRPMEPYRIYLGGGLFVIDWRDKINR